LGCAQLILELGLLGGQLLAQRLEGSGQGVDYQVSRGEQLASFLLVLD